MIVGGILLKANGARIVTLSGTRSAHTRLLDSFHKLELPSKPTQDNVAAFVQTLQAYCADNNIDILCLNQRTEGKGTHAGGSASFRNEGIILATSPVPVQMIHQATIGAALRKHGVDNAIRPDTADLGKAYDIAFTGLA
ncbi:MAG TPA: DUF3010 family protein [Kiritimatiellia bacterium]|nr:DUF3010 family protein [Kiritimatiellia bacterium]HMP00746.1 DUF3010 family protein [Kiritimatiellia bacterium]